MICLNSKFTVCKPNRVCLVLMHFHCDLLHALLASADEVNVVVFANTKQGKLAVQVAQKR